MNPLGLFLLTIFIMLICTTVGMIFGFAMGTTHAEGKPVFRWQERIDASRELLKWAETANLPCDDLSARGQAVFRAGVSVVTLLRHLKSQGQGPAFEISDEKIDAMKAAVAVQQDDLHGI